MAKKNLPVVDAFSELRDSYIDPDSNKVVKVNDELVRELTSLEIQLAASMTNLMLTLKKVRDSKLYLLRCDTFDEYLRKIGMAPRTARRQLQIADTYGSSKHFDELSKLPQSILLDAAKNDDLSAQLCEGEVKTLDGEILTIEEIVNSGAAKLKAELEKTKKNLSNFKAKYEEADEERKLNASELDAWKDKVGEENFIRITKKNDAIAAIYAAEGEIENVVRSIDSIETSDVEVISKLGALIGRIKYAADALEDKWIPHLVTQGD